VIQVQATASSAHRATIMEIAANIIAAPDAVIPLVIIQRENVSRV